MSNNKLVEDYINEQISTREHKFARWGDVIKRLTKDRTFEGAFIGSYSITTQNKQLTLIADQHTWCGQPVSASAVARLVLRDGLRLLGRKRLYWNRKSFPLLEIPQPMFCKPVAYAGRLTYVDISRCFFEIYKRLPFDIRFQGLRVFGGACWFSDFLPGNIADYKLCRNSLVGCMRALTSARIRKGKQVVINNRNQYLSPEHWGFIAHLLHTFARSALDCGAVYFNTDGAIFTSDADAIAWSNRIIDWGLTPAIKAQGTGYVASVGNYQVGKTPAGRINPIPSEFNNLIDTSPYVEQRWIQWL